MPLFGSSHPEPVEAPPARSGSIFSRNKPAPVTTTTTHSPKRQSGTNFFTRRSSRTPSPVGSPRHSTAHSDSHVPASRGLFGLGHKNEADPSIMAAHSKVHEAEEAEKVADRALHQARLAVREAREHVKMLEREAAEECVNFDLFCHFMG